MNHRCAIHPCRDEAEPGHSTCAKHRARQDELHARYEQHKKDADDRRVQAQAEREVMDELVRARVDTILAKRRRARGETP